MQVPSDVLLQAGAIVAPLMLTGLVAWNHLSGKVGRVEEQVRTQNGRLTKLEDGVVYRDTCAAVHTSASEAYQRAAERMEEDRQDRRGLAEQIMRLREEMAARTGEIARLLEETRAQRITRGVAADYPSREEGAG